MTIETDGAGALDGVRVVELGGAISGAFCARLLGDLGADVIKVERPGGGDRVRQMRPLLGTDPKEQDGLFQYLNWNKRSMELDLSSPASGDDFRRLVEHADVIITGLRPGVIDAWGYDVDVLRQWNPGIVVVAISPFGNDGPYAQWKASDLVVQAMSGIMQISGTTTHEPLKHGLRQSLYFAGIVAAFSALTGLFTSRRTGVGASIDVAARDCLASQLVINEAFLSFVGVVQGRTAPVADPLSGIPVPSVDGFVTLQTTPIVPIDLYAQAFNDERLRQPRFETASLRSQHAAVLSDIVAEHVGGVPGRSTFEMICDRGLLAGFVQKAQDLLECPQLANRNVFHTLRVENASHDWKLPYRLASMSKTAIGVRRDAPRCGEHTTSILDELTRLAPRSPGATSFDHPPSSTSDMRPQEPLGPLNGIRVIDLSTVFAVPYMGGLLSDLGAEVIKIEPPRRLDQSRSSLGEAYFDNEPGEEPWNRSGLYNVINRGKRAISLDLSTEEGRSVLRDLVAVSDVLLDNFTPRVMRGWNTTYEDLRQINPGLVMLSNTGYGATGPWSTFKAQGTTLEATMGIFQVTGYENQRPSKAGQSYPDFITCWTGLTLILAALVRRDETKVGEWIDLGMYQLGAFVIPEALLHVQACGEELPRRNADIDAIVSGVFPALGIDKWVVLSVFNEVELGSLATLVPNLGALVATPERLRDDAWRAHVASSIAEWTCRHSPLDTAGRLQKLNIASGAVLDAGDLFEDPQLIYREFYEDVTYPQGSFKSDDRRRKLIGQPFIWTSYLTGVTVRGPAPHFGADNDYVLRELLEMDTDRIEQLGRDGVVTARPLVVPPSTPMDIASQLSSGAIVRVIN